MTVPEWSTYPFTEAEIQTMTYVVPIKDVRQVTAVRIHAYLYLWIRIQLFILRCPVPAPEIKLIFIKIISIKSY